MEPEAAATYCDGLAGSDPGSAAETGERLITTWCETGQLRRAARFALACQTPNRVAWLTAVFKLWGKSQPETAWQFLSEAGSTLGAARTDAATALLTSWASQDPAGLAHDAVGFDDPADRRAANTALFPAWMEANRGAALEWLGGQGTGSEADGAIAHLANMPELLRQSPERATLVAITIADPILRANTLAQVATVWVQHDPQGLRDFLHDAALQPAEQSALSAALEPVE